jgi:hypothetical protein
MIPISLLATKPDGNVFRSQFRQFSPTKGARLNLRSQAGFDGKADKTHRAARPGFSPFVTLPFYTPRV